MPFFRGENGLSFQKQKETKNKTKLTKTNKKGLGPSKLALAKP